MKYTATTQLHIAVIGKYLLKLEERHLQFTSNCHLQLEEQDLPFHLKENDMKYTANAQLHIEEDFAVYASCN